MCELYRLFSKDWEHLVDYSEEVLVEMYDSETYGTKVSSNNGYHLGKRWLSVQVQMWRDDIDQGILFKDELYEDGKFPKWWLDSIFKSM